MSEINSQCNQGLVNSNFESSNVIANLLNKNVFNDASSIEVYQSQCWMNIQTNFKMYGMLEQLKLSLYSSPSQLEAQPAVQMNSMDAFIPKAGNIFAPKPIHATQRGESTRIGRSHSMYVQNPLKKEPFIEDKSSENDKISEEISQFSEKNLKDSNLRKRMNVFRCPHKDRKHYAKNMCNNCYHKQGRNKKATKCPHRDRQNYAKGKCQNCYLNDYHKVKRRMKKESLKPSVFSEQETDRKISVETSSTETHQEARLEAVNAV